MLWQDGATWKPKKKSKVLTFDDDYVIVQIQKHEWKFKIKLENKATFKFS